MIVRVYRYVACMDVSLRTASLGITHGLLHPWVANRLPAYIKVSNKQTVQIHPTFNILTLPNWLTV